MGGCHSLHSQVTEDGNESSSESDSSQGEESCAEEDNAKAGKSEIETSSDEHDASEGEDKQEHPHTQDTPIGVSQLFRENKDTDPKQGSVLPLYKEIRASRTLSKVLGGVTCQPSESVGWSSSPTPSDHSMGPLTSSS